MAKELLTKFNQTPLSLATEFIEAMKKMPSGGEDMEKLNDHMVELENQPLSQEIIDSVTDIGFSHFDATTIPFITKCKPQLSYVFLSWVCSQSSVIPDVISTMVGLYSIYFYSTHTRQEKLTFKWVCDTVGKGKIVNFRAIWPWFTAAATKEGSNIFKKMTPDQLYTFKG